MSTDGLWDDKTEPHPWGKKLHLTLWKLAGRPTPPRLSNAWAPAQLGYEPWVGPAGASRLFYC